MLQGTCTISASSFWFFLDNGKKTGSSLSSLGGMAALLQIVLRASTEQHKSDDQQSGKQEINTKVYY
jgi:hypothetical protein